MGLLAGAAIVLAAASLGWIGIAVIVVVLGGARLLAPRWARWPRTNSSTG